ncbi:ADP-ribosylation factor-like protein 9 isoform X2 [Synchiropus splendidus]|uniref:ADP-ribosylation factor-like protein 9 isoform X2 n=1 Tax=Synchiropus splendidus TaxID=270530 RepID=UPI00237E6AE3|nr:ADP-ribosylation factor-like protein 9 isoform X2 [Synchiropus splendidus]
MSRLRGAALLGAALAGGLAYAAWNYFSSAEEEKERETPPEEEREKEDVGAERREETPQIDDEERVEETVLVEATAPPTVVQSSPAASAPGQVLVLGLDGAGKTSLLQCLSTGCPGVDVEPTKGFNAVSVTREELSLHFLEIGGSEELRQYWPRYMGNALLLVFVVDSADSARFSVARRHLHEMMAADARLPLMVLANKQDLPGACCITDLYEALSLLEVGDRKLFLIGTHAKAGAAELSSGVQDAKELIMQMVCDRK